MLEVCKQLFDQWNLLSVRYCHWKSNEHLTEGLDGDTDLDVYVYPSDKEKAESILSDCRFIECRPQKGHRYPNVFEWIGFDSVTGRLVHVHLHYQIITGTKFCKEYIFPLDELILESRVKDKETGVYVTDPNLETIILFCRIALKAKKKHDIHPGKSDCKEIDFLRERIHKETVRALCCKIMGEKGEEFYSLLTTDKLSRKEWYRIYQIASGWLKPYRKYSGIQVFFRYRYYLIRYYWILLANKRFNQSIICRKTFPGRDLSICLLGQDGSGKSSVTLELCKWLNWKVEAHRFYLGSGEHYNSLFKRLGSVLSKSKGNGNKDSQRQASNTVKKQKKSFKSFIKASLVSWNMLAIARRAYKEVKRARKYMVEGGIPLFDRFPQIQFEGIYDGPKIRDYYSRCGLDFGLVKWMADKEFRYIEKIQDYQPGLVFKLILPPEESMRRKPFENLETITRKHEITQLLQFPDSMVYTIDAAQDYQQEILLIKNMIWNALMRSRS